MAKPPRPGDTLRLASALLDLGLRKPAFEERASECGREDHKAPWRTHRKIVAEEFLSDAHGYLRRLSSLGSLAAAQRAEVLMLPACALVQGKGLSIADYTAALPSGLRVAAGVISLDETGEPLEESETAVFIENNKVTARVDYRSKDPDKLIGFSPSEKLIGFAISSSIQNAERCALPARAREDSTPLFLLDLGHHQYSGRYLEMLISRGLIPRASKSHRRPVVCAVDFWCWKGYSGSASWVRPESALARKPLRIRVPFEAARSAGRREDRLSILDLACPRTRDDRSLWRKGGTRGTLSPR